MAQPDPWQAAVHIRDVEDGDVDAFFDHQREPQALQMAAFPARERDVLMAHWAKIRADPSVVAQTVVVAGQVAGYLVCWNQLGRRAVGYWIGRDYWGRGVATKALSLFLGQVTERPLYAHVAVQNAGSIRVLEKCGFRQVEMRPAGSTPADLAEVDELVFVLEV